MRKLLALFSVGMGALAACGGSTDNSSSATPIPRADFTQKFAEALCDNIGGCCKSAGFAYDAANCVAALKSYYDQALGSGVDYDPNKGGECVAATVNVAKACGESAIPSACSDAFTGTLPPGAACTASVQCAPSPNSDPLCQSGACTQVARGTLGTPCDLTCTKSGSDTACSGNGGGGGATASCYTNDGIYCGPTGLCEKLIPIGGPCDFEGCVNGAYCDSGSQLCTALKSIGSACQSNEECGSSAWCSNTGKCAAEKGVGAACQDGQECTSGQCTDGACASTLVTADLCGG